MKQIYQIRTSQFEVTTDHYEVSQYYLTVRMPKDCWQVFEVAKSHEAIAYRHHGYMWIQFWTNSVHCVNHLLGHYTEAKIRKYFPNTEVLYEKLFDNQLKNNNE